MTFSAAARMSTLKKAVDCGSAKTRIALPIHRKSADKIGGLFSHCLDKGYAIYQFFQSPASPAYLFCILGVLLLQYKHYPANKSQVKF